MVQNVFKDRNGAIILWTVKIQAMNQNAPAENVLPNNDCVTIIKTVLTAKMNSAVMVISLSIKCFLFTFDIIFTAISIFETILNLFEL